MKKNKKALPPPARPPPKPSAPATRGAAPPADAKAEPSADALLVVGIGASAGGLDAFQQFLEAMPPDSGLSFVFVQHLDPHHHSALPEILESTTRMPIREATDQTRIEPNCVYTNPPDRDIAVSEGRIHLVAPTEPHGHRHPIDFLFRSLAHDQGDRAIGVVLSGTGTDGTLGIRAIKGAGGLTIVQDAHSARYDGMPRSAIGTQLIDFVLPAAEIPRVLRDYVRHPYVKAQDAIAPTAAGQLEQIYLVLREQVGHDFSHYKQNTIRRRIERRMAVHRIKRLDDYLRLLQRSAGEVDALFKDLLIGVTNFFRDPEAFTALAARVIPRLFDASSASGQIRIWVPGCSSGEEAYSLAILCAEHMDRTGQNRKVTVFATDIDPGSIEAARVGVYPDSIDADVPPERLARFFTKENGSYKIAKRVREMVIFATQDVLKDPPFSRLDLISCRNLLIYLGPELQRKLMQLFHAVLNPGGALFLGASETVGDVAELFASQDKKWKIYEKRAVATHPLIGVTALNALNEGGVPPRRAADAAQEAPRLPGIGDLTERLLLDAYAPTCAVVDERYDILFTHGRTGRYLELPPGEPHLNILKMARDELLRELRAALHRALKERTDVVRERVAVREDAGRRWVRLVVKPFRGAPPLETLFLVTFEDVPVTAHAVATGSGDGAGALDPRVADLERELAAMRESLQSTVEEVETSNEELRSTNEELQSANEELQSTNEELETSKEELQSVNEELLTVNNELQKKLEELSQANNDLTNLLNSTDIGTVFLDNELRIKRFTPAVGKLVNLIPTDVGRPIADIVTQLVDDDLAAHAGEVLRSLVFDEAEVRTRDGRWYLRRILPYRTSDNVIDGVIITFVNITEVRDAKRMVEAMLSYANGIVNAVRQPVVLLNKDGRVVQANQPFYAIFHARREDTLGARIFDLDGARWAQPDVRARLQGVIDGGAPIDGLDLKQDVPGLGPRSLRLHARRTNFGSKAVAGEAELTVLTIEDVTADDGRALQTHGAPG